MKTGYDNMRNLIWYEDYHNINYIRVSSIVAFSYDKTNDITIVDVGGLSTEEWEYVIKGDHRELLTSAILHDEAKRTTRHA